MPMIATAAGVIAAALNLIVYLPYLRAVRAGTARPQVTTWLIWSTLSTLIIASQWALGGGWSLLLPLAQLAGCGAVCALAWRSNETAFERSDFVAMTVAGAGAVGWLVSSEPIVSLVATVISFGAGSALTVLKTWRDPSSEPVWMWLTGAAAATFAGVAAVADGGGTVLLIYPVYLCAANLAIAGAVVIPSRARTETGCDTAPQPGAQS